MIGVGVGVGVGVVGSIAIIGLVLIGGCVISKKHLKSKSSGVTSGGNEQVIVYISKGGSVQETMMQTLVKQRVVRDGGIVVDDTKLNTLMPAVQIDAGPVAEPTEVPAVASVARSMECEDKNRLPCYMVVTNDGVQNFMLKKFATVSAPSVTVRSEEGTAV